MSFKISENNSRMFSSIREVVVTYSAVVIRKLKRKILQFNFQSLNLTLEVSAWIVMQRTQDQA